MQAQLRMRGHKAQPAAPCQPQLIAEEEDDAWSHAADVPRHAAGASLLLLQRLTGLIEEARSEAAAAAVLECPDLLAIDVDLRDEQVCARCLGLPLRLWHGGLCLAALLLLTDLVLGSSMKLQPGCSRKDLAGCCSSDDRQTQHQHLGRVCPLGHASYPMTNDACLRRSCWRT